MRVKCLLQKNLFEKGVNISHYARKLSACIMGAHKKSNFVAFTNFL